MSNLVGTTLGQYQVVELIGEGGMAYVYKAWQPSLRRYVALKVLASHLANDAGFLKRFHQEAVSAANLKHTNIVTVHDVGVEDGHQYIAMEYIEGESLAERIRSGRAIGPEQVVDIISQVGSALDYAHQKGFIHRDIKPANVLIEPSGRAVLTDFGIAKAVSGSGITGPLTQAGSIFGTPHYMSPEQVREEKLDHRSDLYSLGIVCYEMLTGEVPFDGTTTHSILYAQAHNPPPPLREVNPAVSPPLEATVNRMLSKDREARYESGNAFAQALAQAVSGVWPEDMGEATLVGGRAPTGTELIDTVIGRGLGQDATVLTRRPPVDAMGRRRRWPRVLGVLLLLTMLVGGAVAGWLVLGGRDKSESDLELAQAALADGNQARAGDLFQKVLEDEPGNAEALNGLLEVASGQVQAGEYDAAIATFKKVLGADGDNVAALKGIGGAYEAQEKWQQAADWYEKWTQVAPDDVDARLRLGEAYGRLGGYEQAIAQMQRVTELQPNWARGWEDLAKTYYGLKRYDEALEPLRRWVELEPNNVDAQRMSGWVMFFEKRHEEAEAFFLRCLELEEDNGCYNGLVSVYTVQKRWRDVLSILEHLVEINSTDSVSYQRLGGTNYNLDNYDAALESYLRAIELDDANVKAYEGLAKCYTAIGNHLRAKEAYERLVTLTPNDPQAHRSLGWVLYKLEDYQAAISSFEQASSLDTTNAGAYWGLAESYHALGNEPRAVQYYEEWAALTDENPFIHQQYGRVYYALGQYEAAAKAFLRALALDSQFVYGYVGLGQAQQAQGDCENAMVSFRHALEIDPESPSAKRGLEECNE